MESIDELIEGKIEADGYEKCSYDYQIKEETEDTAWVAANLHNGLGNTVVYYEVEKIDGEWEITDSGLVAMSMVRVDLDYVIKKDGNYELDFFRKEPSYDNQSRELKLMGRSFQDFDISTITGTSFEQYNFPDTMDDVYNGR